MMKFDRKFNTAVARFGSSDLIWVYRISSSEFNALNHDNTLICTKPFDDDGGSKKHFISERGKQRHVLKFLTMKTLKF
jgi:hypothetical protein